MGVIISLLICAFILAYTEKRVRSFQRKTKEQDALLQESFAKKEKKEKQIEIEINNIKKLIAEITERLDLSDKKAYVDNKKSENAEALKKELPNKIYFRWAEEDGTFADKERLMSPDEDTFYEFILDDSRINAEFYFITQSDTQLNKANNSSKKYIERACKFTQSKSMKYVCNPGKAHLEKGKWIIDEMARIDYS